MRTEIEECGTLSPCWRYADEKQKLMAKKYPQAVGVKCYAYYTTGGYHGFIIYHVDNRVVLIFEDEDYCGHGGCGAVWIEGDGKKALLKRLRKIPEYFEGDEVISQLQKALSVFVS